MSGQLGELVISLQADIARFREDMGKAVRVSETSSKKISDGFDSIGKGIVRATSALAAFASVGALAALAKDSINVADNLSKMSQKVGVNIEQLSSMNYAASLADVSTEALAKGMAKLNKNMYDAAKGGQTQVQTFKSLGVSVTDTSGQLRKADEVMMDVAERFAEMEDGPKKTALAMEIFGKAGADMIPLLNSGKKGLREAADEAKRFGLVLTEDAGRQAEEFNDNLTRLEAQASGLAITLGNKLLPSINKVVDAFIKANGVKNPLKGLAAIVDTDPFLNYDFKNNGTTFTAPMPPRPYSPKGNGGTEPDLAASAKAANDAETAFQRYSSTFDGLIQKAELLNPSLDKNQKELMSINNEIAKAIKDNPAYADSLIVAGEFLKKATLNAANFKDEITAVNESIKELEASTTGMAGFGNLGLEPKGGLLSFDSKVKPQKYSLTGLSETPDKFGGNSLNKVADAIGYTEEEAQALSDAYQEILMYQKELFDASPWEGMEQGLKDYINSVATLGEAFENLTVNTMQGMEDAFVDFVHTGKLSFSELADSIINDLIRIQVQAYITKPLAGLLSDGMSLFGDMLGGSLDGSIAGNSSGVMMSDINSYAVGTNYVPETGLALIHKGEAIVPAEYNKPGANGNLSISVPVNVEGNKLLASELRTEIENTVIQVIRRHS